jgi:transglutaminase-like putative cysteine protease
MMTLKQLLVALLMAVSVATIAGEDPKYPVSAIPDALMKDVNVVYRDDHMKFTIHAKNKATFHVHKAVTILNANGKKHAYEIVGYDKLTKVTSFKGFAYDADGKVIARLKASDIYDQSAFDGFSLYSDNRFKRADLSQGTYPYTVEFEYDLEYKFLFFIPSYYLLSEEKVSVEHSDYELIFPENLRPRYKTFNMENKVEERTTKDGLKSLHWTFSNIAPVHFEDYSDPYETISRIMVAPTSFEFDGYAGSMQDWETFGNWINSLNKGRDVLPEATVKKVQALTANAKTDEEKIKIIYEYMQNRTRYVSIQLGIGGFQPFEASVVDQTGYGDCKALSNYMVSMLKHVGVKANYTLIKAGEYAPSLQEDFPSSQFNHAIVSVPNGKDTIWLECTSQSSPFGYQGTFTGDRKALMITDNGARVVNTLKYTADQNVQSRHAEVVVDAMGNANAKVKTTYMGLQYENGELHTVLNDRYDKQKEWLEDNIEIPAFNLNSFTFTNQKAKIPSADVTADLSLNRYASVSGKRLFLVPNLMNRWNRMPEKLESRKTDVLWRHTFTDLDTIEFHVPEGIYPEYLPAPIQLESRFGEYEARFEMTQGKLVYTRKLKMYKGKYPAASYPELSDFLKGINKADNTKMVFLSKT